MKFFIPLFKEPDKAEEVYQAIRKFAVESMKYPVTDRRIFRIEFGHDGRNHEAEVGKVCDVNGEVVVAILESFTYYICTASLGVIRGMPILVGKEHDAHNVEDFEK